MPALPDTIVPTLAPFATLFTNPTKAIAFQLSALE